MKFSQTKILFLFLVKNLLIFQVSSILEIFILIKKYFQNKNSYYLKIDIFLYY